MGIGLSAWAIQPVRHPNINIDPGRMEVGIGHHGDPGIEVVDLETAAQLARRTTRIILPDLPIASANEKVVLISGLGATPQLELVIFYKEVKAFCASKASGSTRPLGAFTSALRKWRELS